MDWAISREPEWIAALGDAGFDLVHPFDAAAAAGEPGLAMLADRTRPRGLLVGNTRALWPRFQAARRDDPALVGAPDPLDRYTELTFARVFPDAPLWFGHRRYGGVFLPMQRLAVATGLASLARTQLAIHPIYGPWFALRAVILAAGDVPPAVVQPPGCMCDTRCDAAFAAAMAARGPDAWRAWIAVRDACPVGRAHRYDEDQLLYHYTNSRDLIV